MDSRSEDGAEYDRGSVCSTAATGLSTLSARIASLTADFGDRLRPGIAEGNEYGPYLNEDGEEVDEEEEEELVELTEEQVLQELDKQEPAFQVCSRLFHSRPPDNPTFKRLTAEHVEHLRQHGFVRLDNFITSDAAARLRSDALVLRRQGRFQDPLAVTPTFAQDADRFHERSARGDAIMWLHARRAPATTPSFSSLITHMQELQEDLAQIMQIRQTSPEFQLSVYPRNGAQYVRHRDAFPDDGSDEHQRKVTAIVYANPNWAPSDGGKLRLWLPKTQPHSQTPSMPQSPVAQLQNGQAGPGPHAQGPAAHYRHISMVSNGSDASPSSSQDSQLNPHRHAFANGHGPALANGHGLANGHASANGLPSSNGHADSNGHGVAYDLPSSNGNSVHEPPAGTVPTSLADLNPSAMQRIDNANANGHASANPMRPGVHFATDLVHGHMGHGHLGCSDDTSEANESTTPFGAGSSALADHASDQASSKSDTLLPSDFVARRSGSISSSANAEAQEGSAHDHTADGSRVGSRQPEEVLRDREASVHERTEVGLEPVVDVAPIAGRCVIILSGAVEHAVLPNFSERVAITAWYQ